MAKKKAAQGVSIEAAVREHAHDEALLADCIKSAVAEIRAKTSTASQPDLFDHQLTILDSAAARMAERSGALLVALNGAPAAESAPAESEEPATSEEAAPETDTPPAE